MNEKIKENLITGTIKDLETDETHDIGPFYLYSTGCELDAIIKVLSTHSSCYTNSDDEITREVSVYCLALDCHGNVFKMSLYFLPDSLAEEEKITAEITEGKIMIAKGRYHILPNDEYVFILNNPEYYPLSPEYSLEDVEEVFRFNNTYNKNRLT